MNVFLKRMLRDLGIAKGLIALRNTVIVNRGSRLRYFCRYLHCLK